MADEESHHSSVKILEVSRVPPSPSPSLPVSLPLTFFDLQLLRFPQCQLLFFYQTETSSCFFNEVIIPKLKQSLSLILQHYLPLAGNLIWPQNSHKPFIQFLQGDHVLFTVAESHADFHHLSSYGFREEPAFHSLVPQLSASHDHVAAIALQVTRYQNNGFSLGLTTHHGVIDGASSSLFFNSWAKICHNLLHVNGESSSIPITTSDLILPFYDRTTINDPAGLEAIYLNALLNMDGPNNKTLNILSFKTEPDWIQCSLELSGQNLKKLKQWILKKQQKEHSFHLSSFTVTCAYLCVCVAKSEGLRDKRMALAFPVNARSRLEPPLPENYFGNCIVSRSSTIEGNELLSENGMIVAAEAISMAIKSLEGGVLKGSEKTAPNQITINLDENPQQIIVVAGSPRFEVYKADFGWGRPKKVDAFTLQKGVFLLTDSRNGDGGVEIGLVGKINEMETFTALFAQGLELV